MLAEDPRPLLDKSAIEDIVKEILQQQGIIKAEPKTESKMEAFIETKVIQDKKEKMPVVSMEPQNMVNDDMRAIIARTLATFRNE